MTLKDLDIGQSAIVTTVGGEGALRQHFLDMGVIPGAEVQLVKFAPMGDPMELRIHDYQLTLRLADAAQIQARPITAEEHKEHQLWKKEQHPATKAELDAAEAAKDGKFFDDD